MLKEHSFLLIKKCVDGIIYLYFGGEKMDNIYIGIYFFGGNYTIIFVSKHFTNFICF